MASSRKSFDEINITPLTDIFLVLLIIMMVIAPLLDQQGLNLTVPENVEQEKVTENPKILTVLVAANDVYYIENEEVSTPELESFLKAHAKDYTDGLLIQTDGESTHGAIVKVMDFARNSGITSISVSEM